jgi:hypothetical protein
MQKIFEIGTKEFMTGIAPSSQLQTGGLWHHATGISVASDFTVGSDDIGILQAAPTPDDITGSVIADVVIAGALDAGATDGVYYLWDKSGILYSIDLVGDNNPVKITVGSAAGASANGLFIISHTTGVKRVYYFREGDFGYYGDLNGTPSFHTAQYSTGVVSTPHHPTHRLFDRVYFGNGRYIGQVQDDGSGDIDYDSQALDFENDYITTCLSDDGTYLVAGITRTAGSTASLYGSSKVIFWDTSSDSWQREWDLPGETILSVRRVNQTMLAITARGIYTFTFNTPPQPLDYPLPSAAIPPYTFPTHGATTVLNEALLVGGTDLISSFGKLIPAMPNAFMQPFSSFNGSSIILIDSVRQGRLFVSTADGKLYRVTFGATPLTGVSAETIFVDLKAWWQVRKVVLEFDGALTTSDEMSIQVQTDPEASAQDWGDATFTDNGAIRTKDIFNSIDARKLKVIINFDAGAVKLRSFQVWGDPIEAPANPRV